MGDSVSSKDPEKSFVPGESLSNGDKVYSDKESGLNHDNPRSSSSTNHDIERAQSRTSAGAHRHEVDDEYETDDGAAPSVLDRVASRITSRSSVAPGPPPDGGWQAWSQCIGGHFVISNSWGWINSFGVWQDYLPEILPERTAFEISLIGSLTVFLLFFLGTFTGRLADAGLFRHVIIAGSIFQSVGIFMTSLCKEYWQFMLAQGICIGIGNGMLFCPTLALVSTYFLKNRAIAIGVTASGSVTGGLIFPIMARQLLPKIGFGWTVRAIGLVQLVSLIIANVLAKPRIRPRKTGNLVEWSAFKELEYTFYACAAFCFFWGLYMPFYYIAAFSRDELKYHPFSFENSLNLLLVINGVGLIGRLIPNYYADKFGAINLFIPICFVNALLVYCWMAVETPAALYVWSCLYGLFAAGIQSLFPAALSFLTEDVRKLGVRMGMVFTIVSFAVLTGPPIAGAIIDNGGGYKGAQGFAGSALAMGTVLLFCAKLAKMKKTGMGWTGKV